MTRPRPALRLGTRRSPLALHQAALVRDAIARAIPTSSRAGRDRQRRRRRPARPARHRRARHLRARARAAARATARSTPPCTRARTSRSTTPAGLVLAAWLPREDPRDALVGSRLRRCSTCRTARRSRPAARGAWRRCARCAPTCSHEPIRGNVATRIQRAARARRRGLRARDGRPASARPRRRSAHDIRPIAVDAARARGRAGRGRRAGARPGLRRAPASTGARSTTSRDAPSRAARARARAPLGGGCDRPVGVHVELDAGPRPRLPRRRPTTPGTARHLDVVGLELGTLVSVQRRARRRRRGALDRRASSRRCSPTLVGAQLVEVAR